jgi:hypothetical protein
MAKQNRGGFYSSVKHHLFRRFKIQYGAVLPFLKRAYAHLERWIRLSRYWLVVRVLRPYKYTNGFPTFESFEHHIGHRPEFRFKLAWTYVRFADRFLGQPRDLATTRECVRKKDGATLRYHDATNTFGVLHAGRIIGTVFKPKRGLQYYLDECKR